MSTLLEKAKAAKIERQPHIHSKEEIELAVAYANAEVTGSQCIAAMNSKKGGVNYLYRMIGAIRAGVELGIIKRIEYVKKP